MLYLQLLGMNWICFVARNSSDTLLGAACTGLSSIYPESDIVCRYTAHNQQLLLLAVQFEVHPDTSYYQAERLCSSWGSMGVLDRRT